MSKISIKRHCAGIDFCDSAFALKAVTAPPELAEEPLPELIFRTVLHDRPDVVAGCPGRMVEETSTESDILVIRKTFLSNDGGMAAIRVKVENRRNEAVHLDTLIPITTEGGGGLTVGGEGAAAWRVLKLGRFKSDIPAVFRPAKQDIDYKDAAFNAQNVTAGMGVQGDVSAHYDFNQIVSEPITFIKHDQRKDVEGLALAVLGQRDHLTSILYQFDGESKQLRRLAVVCEFDEQRIDPGASVETHWIVLFTADTEQDALDRFVALQRVELQIPEPQPPRSLYCSWYFYGREFLPSDLKENLNELKKNPVPFDTFIIDNGWMDAFGDYHANHKWPDGMAMAADMIAEAGMEPGIWTTPFVMMKHSRLAKEHPELIARDKYGEPVTFGYVEGACYVVDVTHPNCMAYFRDVYGRLREWGYTYHKLDFVRAIAVNPDIRFHDRTVNRPMAYRKGLKMIRDAIGPGGYILACGGLYDAANYGVADSIRTGSDSIGSWEHPSGDRAAGTLVQVKQGLFRAYMSNLICTDPDCLMLRRREAPFRMHEAEKHNWLSDGKFTDEEAFSLVVRQYLSGGSTNITERLAELPDDRRRLLRHIIPAVTPPARILDFETSNCPTLAVTDVQPRCMTLEPWKTLSVSNWEDRPVTRTIRLDIAGLSPGLRYAVQELPEGRFRGLCTSEDELTLDVPAHGTCVLRIAAWQNQPLVLGTDLHITGGACELADIKISESVVSGRVETPWEKHPVCVSVLFPAVPEPVVAVEYVEPNKPFEITFALNAVI